MTRIYETTSILNPYFKEMFLNFLRDLKDKRGGRAYAVHHLLLTFWYNFYQA